MNKTQVLDSLRSRAENFKVETLEVSDAVWAEIGKLHKELIEIDPHYTWVALLGPGSSGTIQITCVPRCNSEDATVQAEFQKRVAVFYDLLEMMETEGLT